jgi:hypothetical protein
VEGIGAGRVGVWSRWERDNRDRFYEFIHSKDLKDEVLRWLIGRGGDTGSDTQPRIVNLVYCGHGFPVTGGLHLGNTDSASTLLPWELVSILDKYSKNTTFTLHLLSCYGGAWVDALAASKLSSTYVHTASGKSEMASSFRSDSGEYRSSLFASAVLASLHEGGTVREHEWRVQDFKHKNLDRVPVEHNPILQVEPAKRLDESIRSVLHAPLTWFHRMWYIASNRATQTGVFDLDIRISNRPFIDV